MDNEVYYYEIGEGRWQGSFHFEITDWARFRAAELGPRDRLLAVMLDLAERLPGRADMRGEILCDPEELDGVARVEVSVRRFGIEIYRLRGHYALGADGRGVDIHIQHRYGPVGLPWFQKRASAIIDNGGRTATYQMRLLGTPFEGVYEVDDRLRHLAAAYRTEWGECREIMDRRGALKPRRGEARARWTALVDAARELEALARGYDAAGEVRAPFCHVYAYFVRDLAYGLEDEDFEDPDWVVRLGRAFVRIYVDAMAAHDAGRAPKAWRRALDTLESSPHTAVEELGLCMLVHIVHDLPRALAQVGLTSPDGRPRIGDYHRVNRALERAIEPLQVRLSSRYNPIAGAVDVVLGRMDEAMAAEVIEQSRTLAWYEATRLSDPGARAEAERDVQARIEAACRALRGGHPLNRGARAVARRATRLLRRRPRHPAPAEATFGPAAQRPNRDEAPWIDALVRSRGRRGQSAGRVDGSRLEADWRPRGHEGRLDAPLLSPRELERLGPLTHPEADDPTPAPVQTRWTLAAEALDEAGDSADRLARLGVDHAAAEAARGLQSGLLRALREGFDHAEQALGAGVDALEALGLPAEAVISALDDPTSGHDAGTDVFVARAAAFFPVALEQVGWIVDPENWSEVIPHVEASTWLQRDHDRGIVYERVNILSPWVEHHPLVLETELQAELRETADEVRVDYALERSIGDVFDLDEGFIAARSLGPNRTAVLIEKRLRIVGHPLLYAMLRFNPDGLAALLTAWIHDAARRGAARGPPPQSS